MANVEFLHRDCPSCGSQKSTREVSSKIRAEDMAFAELENFWSGINVDKRFFSYMRCNNCEILFNSSFFHDTQLQQLYSNLAPNMEEETGADAISATQTGYFDDAIQRGAPLIGDYLEIGPDVGHVTRIAADRGSFDRFWLFEPNSAVHGALTAATLGRPNTISTGMTDLSSVPDGSVGMAVMIHVLDHMVDPLAMLEQVRRKLRPDGALVTVTHNEKSALRYAMGVRWPPFCLQHPEVYNPASISAMMQRAGFEDVVVQRSKNYFPLDFLAKQGAGVLGLKLNWVPLPRFSVGLRLGNIMTIARTKAISDG